MSALLRERRFAGWRQDAFRRRAIWPGKARTAVNPVCRRFAVSYAGAADFKHKKSRLAGKSGENHAEPFLLYLPERGFARGTLDKEKRLFLCNMTKIALMFFLPLRKKSKRVERPGEKRLPPGAELTHPARANLSRCMKQRGQKQIVKNSEPPAIVARPEAIKTAPVTLAL